MGWEVKDSLRRSAVVGVERESGGSVTFLDRLGSIVKRGCVTAGGDSLGVVGGFTFVGI